MKKIFFVLLAITLCLSVFSGCTVLVPEKGDGTQPSILTDSDVYETGARIDPSFSDRYTSLLLQTSEGVSSVSVSSLPGGYDYSFDGEAAKEVVDYFTNLNLISDFTENPNEYDGMTWVVNVEYDNGASETLYHFGNMFVRRESGSWYKMNYDEAARFATLLTELSDDLNGNSDVNGGSDFEPGVILLGLKEQYEGAIGELFPELSIAEVEDINLTWYEQIKDLPDMEQQIENAQSKIGTEFIVILTDTTKEAVLAGIASIEGNPIVDYVSPNYVVEPS